jgi:ring-1,2-phenylacetyl-CoA epoxidase subunit PaaC
VTPDQQLTAYTLRLGDNALVLGQRMLELVAASPELEEELANANLALDYIGQARLYYSYAAEREGQGRSEDDLAFLRHEREFRNLLLLEQPNGHFGDTIVRQVLFDTFYQLQLAALVSCGDERLAEIAARATKEVRYHLRHAERWLVRLGDGTATSHSRAQQSLDDLWRYTGEMFVADELDEAMLTFFGGPDLELIEGEWQNVIAAVVSEAALTLPSAPGMAGGGKQGMHTEHFGYLIAEMQHLPRSFPGERW